MSARLRLLAVGTVAVLGLIGTLVPNAVGATADPQAQRNAVRAKKAQLARQLDTLTASEDQLVDAAKALDDDVQGAAADAEAARQASAASEAELVQAQQAVADTQARVETMTKTLVGRAVDQYMAPRTDVGGDLVGTDDLAATASRQTLLDTVAAKDADLLDQLGAAKEDLMAEQKAVEAANARTLERRRQAEQRLSDLKQAQAEKQKLAAAVEDRKQGVLKEIDAESKAEADLTKIISARVPAVVGGNSTATSTGCIWPAKGSVTSEFGMRWGRLHAGIDVAAPTGTPIWAAKAGTVIFVGQESGYGNTVIINNGGNLTTLYAHMSRFGTSEGQQVQQGQVIGAIGTTGDATGPHVHFETRYGGVPSNPRSCLG
ncbi:MAG TPA: peptidoglycan DD-metalloendopeptidase family protein [Acidimicrobiales bacterium]|jgi:murein DD-endopeptidase MepM/ murein hydrolase activator NlpD